MTRFESKGLFPKKENGSLARGAPCTVHSSTDSPMVSFPGVVGKTAMSTSSTR